MNLKIPAGITTVALIAAFWIWAHHEDLEHTGFEWAYRSKYYPVHGDGCQLLEKTLGADAQLPQKLMAVMAWTNDKDAARNPYGLDFPAFSDVQHQALVRLLAIQKKSFQVSPPPQHRATTRIDHTGAFVIDSDANGMIVEGTASVYPDEFDQHPWEGNYLLERFKFDAQGKLLERSAVHTN